MAIDLNHDTSSPSSLPPLNMGVIGITLIVATLAIFIMYPSTWRALAQPFLQWRQPEAAEETTNAQTNANTTTEDKPKAPAPNGTAPSKTDADRIAMPPPPPPPTIRMPVPEIVENGKTDEEEEEEEEATTPKAVPTIVQNGGSIPTLSLSADDDNDDEDDTDNMPPPMFPSPYSAQRAGASADPSRRSAVPPVAGPTLTTTAPSAPSNPSFGLMAPPPRPAVNRGAAALAPINAARRPANLPIPNRGPPTSLRAPAAGSSSLAPPPSSTTKPAKPARKVVLAPGHSPLDWARVTSDPVGNRLRGNLPDDAPYLLRVTPSQLKQMNGRKGRDAWTVLGGMVYNITPYVPFHPGGAGELLRCAGKDGNQLFNDVHSWVNYDNMLSACRIGVMVEEHAATTSPMEEMD